MFINQFNQKIYADWVSFSVSKEDFPNLIATVLRTDARDSSIGVELEVNEETSIVSKITITNVKEENAETVRIAFGFMESPALHDGTITITDSQAHEAILFMVDIILDADCHECPYRLDEDGDFILSMRFYDFIEKTFGF